MVVTRHGGVTIGVKNMIRNYSENDRPFIQDIANRAWRDIFKMFRQTYGEELFNIIFPNADELKGRQVGEGCDLHPESVMVCEEGGRIVGFVTFQLDREKKIGSIGNNAVDPECGLKGVGQQMYRAVLERFRAEGMRYASVITGMDEAHARARRAYERAGFNIRHERVNYFMKL